MRIENFLLAQNSSIDREKNTLSVFDLVEDLDVVTNSPTVAIPVQVIAILKREESERGELSFTGVLQLIGPEGETIVKQDLKVKMEPAHRRLRIKVNFVMPITKNGLYKVRLDGADGKKLMAETDVKVSLRSIKPESASA